jgi:PKD repeat protein
MKETKRTSYGFMLLHSVICLLLLSCAPQEFDDHSLGVIDTVTSDQVSFTFAASPSNPNEYSFTSTSTIRTPHALLWDLGNGETGKGNSVTSTYPSAGSYTITLTAYAPDGTSVTVTQNIVIASDL